MADNVVANSGSGGVTFASDEVVIGGATVQVPRAKLGFGADGTYSGDVSSSNPLPVGAAQSGTWTVAVSGTVAVSSANVVATSSAGGSVGITGTVATSSAGGAVGITGTVAITSTAIAISGTPTVFANQSGAPWSVSSAGGSVGITGTVATSNAGGSIGITGTVAVSGTPRSATVDSFTAKLATDTIQNGLTALTPKFAAIAISGNGANLVVTSVNGKKLRVLAYNLMAQSAVNAKFQSNSTDLTGLKYMAANGGIVADFNPVGWFETVASSGLGINLSAGNPVGGELVYVEV